MAYPSIAAAPGALWCRVCHSLCRAVSQDILFLQVSVPYWCAFLLSYMGGRCTANKCASNAKKICWERWSFLGLCNRKSVLPAAPCACAMETVSSDDWRIMTVPWRIRIAVLLFAIMACMELANCGKSRRVDSGPGQIGASSLACGVSD